MTDDLDRPGPSIPGAGRTRERTTAATKRRRLERRERMLRGGFMVPGEGRCIALDLGTRTGVAVYDARRCGLSDCVDVYSWNLRPRDGEGDGMRTLRFERFLVELLDESPVLWVAYERVHRHFGVQASHVYGQLMGLVMTRCEQAGIIYRAVPVSMGKLASTGNGQASKDMVAEAVHGHFAAVSRRIRSNTRISEDESDALGVLMAALMDLD